MATLLVSLVESSKVANALSVASMSTVGGKMTLLGVNVYLIIAIGVVSSLLVLMLLLYTVLQCSAAPTKEGSMPAKCMLLCWSVWGTGSGQLHYSVPEEAKHGTFVGRIAQDLGLELAELVPRLFRVASKERGDLLEVNLQNGILFVNSRVDREELCGRSAECSIHLEVIVDRPLQVFHVEVEVKDINDNPPVFPESNKSIIIAESRPLETRFPLDGASDADIGVNSALTYRLDPSDYFTLDTQNSREQMSLLSLVLRKTLDREEIQEHSLLLTASDGGKPALTGTVQLLIRILDVNDNAPEFDQFVYKVKVLENALNGTLVIKLNATDPDDGPNADIVYSFRRPISPAVVHAFNINPKSGEIRIKDKLDFEENKFYEISVEAVDRGNIPMTGHCTLLVEVVDINDNAPEVSITSLSLPVREDTQPSAVIALLSVSDLDSGVNGKVTCSLTPHVPFKLVSTFKNYYSLVLDSTLDRESTSSYELVVTARDGGSPSLWATATVSVEVADVNDNAPVFAQAEYTVFVKENNPPGSPILTVCARDADAQENARVSYSLVERREDAPRQRLLVLVRDHGEPALTATATVLVSLVESGQAPKASLRALAGDSGPEVTLVDVNVYLIIAICAVSSLLVLTLLLYTALRCSAAHTESACGPGKPTLVCSSAVGSWSYSQQRGQRVCSGEGPPKTDLMAFSPSLPPVLCSKEESHQSNEQAEHLKERFPHLGDKLSIPRSHSPQSSLFPAARVLRESGAWFQVIAGGAWTPKGRMVSWRVAVLCLWVSRGPAAVQLAHLVSEETERGEAVAIVTVDLNRPAAALSLRNFRFLSGYSESYFEVDLSSGSLAVREPGDRKQLRDQSCLSLDL
ncbi:Protocadherin alpha-13 [Fukomys damarensis]|uniref:Protocadherin alpha-13 n=1 Tax=Fukomys damarensis TaxID=885580 RepID=A0A091CKX2_FUKDA|nr:Protocadherin alpha-13 [Fukomys damarensis]